MDALLPALIVAALAELGDGTNLLAMLLGRRFGRSLPVLIGIALAAALTMGLGAAAGHAATAVVNHRALLLMTGLALLIAGGSALFRVKPPAAPDGWRLGALVSSFGAFFILEFGDKTQFVIAALAGSSGHPALAAAGGAAGVTLASVPAVLLGDKWTTLAPWRAIRAGIGVVLIVAGLFLALGALQLR